MKSSQPPLEGISTASDRGASHHRIANQEAGTAFYASCLSTWVETLASVGFAVDVSTEASRARALRPCGFLAPNIAHLAVTCEGFLDISEGEREALLLPLVGVSMRAVVLARIAYIAAHPEEFPSAEKEREWVTCGLCASWEVAADVLRLGSGAFLCLVLLGSGVMDANYRLTEAEFTGTAGEAACLSYLAAEKWFSEAPFFVQCRDGSFQSLQAWADGCGKGAPLVLDTLGHYVCVLVSPPALTGSWEFHVLDTVSESQNPVLERIEAELANQAPLLLEDHSIAAVTGQGQQQQQ